MSRKCYEETGPAEFQLNAATLYVVQTHFHASKCVCVCVCSRAGNNDAKSSDGAGARSSDNPRVRHHGVPADRQLLGEGRPETDRLRQVPRRRLRRRRPPHRPVRSPQLDKLSPDRSSRSDRATATGLGHASLAALARSNQDNKDVL